MTTEKRLLEVFRGSGVAHGRTTVGRTGRNGKAEAKSKVVREPLTEEAMLAANSDASPASESTPRGTPTQLVAVDGPIAGQTFTLKAGENRIGRTEGELVLTGDSQASRSHCSITLQDGAATLTDPGSTNGTQLNGSRVAPGAPQAVYVGDVLHIGEGNYRLE